MADVGQAQANAEIVRDLTIGLALAPDSKVLFVGAGPGQMFNHVSADFLQSFRLTFTDINQEFLSRLAERATAAGLTRFETIIDDVEESKLQEAVDLAVVVLVLEHVDWRKALENLIAMPCKRLVIVIQKNPPEMETNVSPHRPLRGSLQEASSGEQAHLIDEDDLTAFLAAREYVVAAKDERVVPDDKRMCGLLFLSRTGLVVA